MKKQNNIFIVLALCVCLIAVIFTGCNKSGGNYDNAAGPSSGEKNQYDIVVSDERLIVYEVNASLTVEDVDRSIKTIRENLKTADGYETETRKNNNGYFYCTLSVPTKNLAAFLNTLEGVGSMNSCTVSSEDITERYMSIEAQKAIYVKQREFLEAELAAATDVKEKREIISALAEIAVKLDGYDTELKNLKKRAEYSTVYLRVYEKDTYTPPSYWDELGEVLFGSTSAAGIFVGFLFKVAVALLPFAALAAIVYGLVILVIFIVCKAKKRPFDMFKKAKEKREIRYREKILRAKQKEVYLEELRKHTNELAPSQEEKQN